MIGPRPTAADLWRRDIELGRTFAVKRTFTAEDVKRFAAASGVWSPLHVDPGYAVSTEFGGCVLHGILRASLFSQLVGRHILGTLARYLGQELTFRRPAPVGETVRASARGTGQNGATATLALATEIRNTAGLIAVSGTPKVKARDTRPVADPKSGCIPQRAESGQRVAPVTGAARGIGAAIGRTLAARGSAVAVNFLRSTDLAVQEVHAIRQAGGRAVAVQADGREPKDVSRLVQTGTDEPGSPTLGVNAAIGGLEHQRFTDFAWTDFQRHIESQLKAVVQVRQAVYPSLKAAGGGAIVNVLLQVTSGAPPALMADSVAATYALHGLSKASAVEWAADGIRVNPVSPDLARTELTEHDQERVFMTEAARVPLRRLASPEDVANTIAFLLSDESALLTGVDVQVSGGQGMP